MDENYVVVKTVVSRVIPDKEVAKKIALLYREQGYGSEVLTTDEYRERYKDGQQDLTKV